MKRGWIWAALRKLGGRRGITFRAKRKLGKETGQSGDVILQGCVKELLGHIQPRVETMTLKWHQPAPLGNFDQQGR